MNADDATALANLKGKLQGQPPCVPWLIRVVEELDARVKELEAGDIDEALSAKDAAIAERDAAMAKLAAQVARFEKLHLPDPGEYYRSIEKDRFEAPKLKEADESTSR